MTFKSQIGQNLTHHRSKLVSGSGESGCKDSVGMRRVLVDNEIFVVSHRVDTRRKTLQVRRHLGQATSSLFNPLPKQ